MHDVCEAIGVLGGDDPARALEASHHLLDLAQYALRSLNLNAGAGVLRRALKAGDEPLQAFDQAEDALRRARTEAVCAWVDALGCRGTALRRLDRLNEARRRFSEALQRCRCDRCLVRIRRRQVYLAIYERNPRDAVRQAEQALQACRRLDDRVLEGRVLLARASVFYYFGRVHRALEDARRALTLIPPSDEHYFLGGLQNLACCLAAADRQEDWEEALGVISRTLTAVGKTPGLRQLKIRLRWAKVLALHRLGETSKRALQRRMIEVCEDFFRLGLTRDVRDAAASASDLALLGAPADVVCWAASQARMMQKEDDPLAEALDRLREAGRENREIAAAAYAVRRSCVGALPLPESLRAA